MEKIQQIWQENKKFILQTGGGLAVFLILQSCVVNGIIGRGAESIRDSNAKVEREVLKLRSDVLQRYPEEKKNLEELQKIESEVASRYLTPPPADVPDPKRAAPQIQFTERIDKIWNDLRVRANQRNVKIPEKITASDLRVSAGAAPEDLSRCASYLEILGRALPTCADQGMVQIDKPVIYLPEEAAPVHGDDESVLVVYRRVGLTVQGPYDAFQRVIAEFQKPGFVQARIAGLDTRGTAGPNVLRGQLEFVGIILEKEAAEPGAAKAAPQPSESPAAPRKSRARRKT